MALVVSNVGEGEMLKRVLNITVTDNDVVIRLYSNNYTPVEASVVGDFTEITATGYSAVTATPGNWVITEGDPTDASYPQTEFALSSAEPEVYGYYITNSAGDILLWSERFVDGPYVIGAGGGSIFITPKIELS
jgi:hypothetical protein